MAEAIHLYPHSINTLTTDNVTSLHADAAVDELQRFIKAAASTTTSSKDPAPVSGARRPTRQGAGGILSKEAVTKALLGFAMFIAKFATTEAANVGMDDEKAMTVYGSVGPGAPRIPTSAEAVLITMLVGLLTLVYFLGVKMGRRQEVLKKDASTQIEHAWGRALEHLTCEGLHYELGRIGFRTDGLKHDMMLRLSTEQTRRKGDSRAFPLD